MTAAQSLAAWPSEDAAVAMRDRPPGSWQAAERAAEILRRYPAVAEDEVDWLVERLPRMAMVHLALMASDEALAPRLEAFQQDHRGRIRTPFRHYAALLVPAGMLIAGAIWQLLA